MRRRAGSVADIVRSVAISSGQAKSAASAAGLARKRALTSQISQSGQMALSIINRAAPVPNSASLPGTFAALTAFLPKRKENRMTTEARETATLIGSDKVEGTAVYGADDQ
jgi:hypothetical protein